jgi:hypothetical protein
LGDKAGKTFTGFRGRFGVEGVARDRGLDFGDFVLVVDGFGEFLGEGFGDLYFGCWCSVESLVEC